MWRFALVSAALPLVLLAPPAHAMLDGGNLMQAAGLVAGPSLKLRDTMNFEDCARPKAPSTCGVYYCGKGKLTLAVALEYREPSVLVEVSCRTGESMLLDSSPVAKPIGKAFSAAVKAGTALAGGGRCMEVSSPGAGGTRDRSESSMWQFESRAFAVTPLDRYMAASASGKKLKSAAYNLTCDALMYFGAGNWRSMMTGGGVFPQTNAVIPEIPSGLGDLLDKASGVASGDWSAVTTDAVGNVLGEGGGIGDWSTVTTDASGNVIGEAGSALDKAAEAKGMAELATCSPHTFALAKASAHWAFGLLPLFMSDLTLPRTCWTAGNMVDNLTATPAAMAQVSTGGLTEMACAGSAMFGVDGGAISMIHEKTLGLAGNCLGGWGPKDPSVGYSPNAIRPLSAGLVGWRAYNYAVQAGVKAGKRSKGGNLKNTRGKVMFNLDYPFINNSGPLSDVVKPFTGGRRHSHKGSGCYEPGTMNPSWYTQGETYITDPATFLSSLTEDTYNQITKQGLPTNNGDYVFTYWKNTRCCIPIKCPQRTYRDY